MDPTPFARNYAWPLSSYLRTEQVTTLDSWTGLIVVFVAAMETLIARWSFYIWCGGHVQANVQCSGILQR
jgi:hypothetical protein